MTDPDPSGRGTPPAGEPRPVASLLRRLAEVLRSEVDTAELTVAGGDTVRIVDVSEVEQWLREWADRIESGEPHP